MMYAQGGWRPFFRGMPALALREVLFACVYEPFKYRPSENVGPPRALPLVVLHNSLVGFLGAVISSPLNYAQKMQYGHPKDMKALGLSPLLSSAFCEASRASNPFRYLQQRMAIGWGSVRCGFGIAINQMVTDYVRMKING